MDVAWQEWQIAVNASTAVDRILALDAQVMCAREATNGLRGSTDAMLEAVNVHEETVLELAAVESKGLRFYFGVAVGFVAVATGAAVGETACAADDGEVA